MFHHHAGELKCTLHEGHHRTFVECHYHDEYPVKRFLPLPHEQTVTMYAKAKVTQ